MTKQEYQNLKAIKVLFYYDGIQDTIFQDPESKQYYLGISNIDDYSLLVEIEEGLITPMCEFYEHLNQNTFDNINKIILQDATTYLFDWNENFLGVLSWGCAFDKFFT